MLKKLLLAAGCLLFINICPTPAEGQLVPFLIRGAVGRAAAGAVVRSAVARSIGRGTLRSSLRRPAIISRGRGWGSSNGYTRIRRTSTFARGNRIYPVVRGGVEILRMYLRNPNRNFSRVETFGTGRESGRGRRQDGRYGTQSDGRCPQ